MSLMLMTQSNQPSTVTRKVPSTRAVSELAHRCGGVLAHNVVASIFDVRLRAGFNLRLLTSAGFIFATLTAPTGRTVSSLRVNSLTKEEMEKLYKWIEKTVPKPKKVKRK